MATKSVLSNVDIIKSFVFERQPVTLDEIATELRRQMASIKSDELARERYVLPVLRAQPYYREVEGRWQINKDDLPEYEVLHEVMREEHRLLYERDVRSKVAKKLGIKVGAVVLDLEKADGLIKIGSHWSMADWVLVNDQAEEVLVQHGNGLNEKDLLKAICERFGLDPTKAILHLKGDKQKRFVQDRKLWYLKKDFEEKQKKEPEQRMTLPELKTGEIDMALEGSFLEAQVSRGDDREFSESAGKAKLKKALKKQAQEILEQRDSGTQEDLAVKLSQVLTAAGVDEYGVKSYQRVEAAARERGLSPKERDDIQGFVDQLLEQETVGVGAPLASVVNAPLSARKIQDVLRLKYLDYTRDRAVIPQEYYRFMIETLHPTVNDSVLHPSCMEGNLTVELLNYLHDRLDGAAWALIDDDSSIEIVQPDSSRYRLTSKDAGLLEKARDKFMVSQVDLINHFLNYKYTGIEADKVLGHAARVITRLSGYEHTYIVSQDFLSQLPEIFNHPPNETNTISDRFDRIMGNFTFTQDQNLAANYLDESLTLLADGGQLGVFVLAELVKLLHEHGLLGEFLQGMAVTHYIKLPVIEGRHEVVALIIKSLDDEETPPIISAQVADFRSANALSNALQKESSGSGMYELVDPMALTTLIN
ncbi:hypothetical protein JW859_06215 [bacterium]|nr:hypothetical protein [bacterium]